MTGIEGLKKISGYSFEDVVAILDKKQIPYEIVSEPKMQRGFFRASDISLNSISDGLKLKHLVRPTCTRVRVAYYHAYYDVPSLKYLRNLGKGIKVSRGRIVEQTVAYH